jgi:hypothetical protein
VVRDDELSGVEGKRAARPLYRQLEVERSARQWCTGASCNFRGGSTTCGSSLQCNGTRRAAGDDAEDGRRAWRSAACASAALQSDGTTRAAGGDGAEATAALTAQLTPGQRGVRECS